MAARAFASAAALEEPAPRPVMNRAGGYTASTPASQAGGGAACSGADGAEGAEGAVAQEMIAARVNRHREAGKKCFIKAHSFRKDGMNDKFLSAA
jgi:hypothetical protein